MAICRLCETRNLFSMFTVKDKYSICRCPNCGFVQLKNPPSDEEINSIYQSIYFSHGKYKDNNTLLKENVRRFQLVKKYLREKSKVLEIGCGMGEFIKYSKARFLMEGFDISANAIEIAKQQNPDIANKLWAGQIENQIFQAESFDGICMWDVLEHIWDFIPACQKVIDALKPNGYLFISTPNIGSWNANLTGKYWAMMTPPEHMNFFYKKNIYYIFENIFENKTKIVESHSKGKWVNIGFLLYKINRVMPDIVPDLVMRLFEQGAFSRLATYVPTGDIQYSIIQKL